MIEPNFFSDSINTMFFNFKLSEYNEQKLEVLDLEVIPNAKIEKKYLSALLG